MEQRKARNKKGGKVVKQKHESHKEIPPPQNPPNEPVAAPMGIKNLTLEDYDYVNADKTQFAHLKRETQADNTIENKLQTTGHHSRRKIVSNWTKYEEIPDLETPGKDFQTLLDVPISEGGHFIFKSEKNWAIEVTKYSDLFSLNVKKLARDINCIPFTEYINVEDKYFTMDQLTRFHNLAEKSKTYVEVDSISDILKECFKENSVKNREVDNVSESEVADVLSETSEQENVEEDLDFLLSLKEPVVIQQHRAAPSIYPNHAEEEKSQPSTAPVKSIDLEKWLDSLLDD